MNTTSEMPLAQTMRKAEIHLQEGRPQKAEQFLGKVLAMLPRHPQANSRMGVLMMHEGRHDQAIEHLRMACSAEPKVIFHWLRLIAAYQLIGDTAAAQQALEEAAQHDWPQEALVRLSRTALEPHTQRQGSLLAIYQAGEDAMTTEIAARLFINDFPDHPLGWQILGALLHDHGRLEEALGVKQETVKRFPKDANAHNNLACTARRQLS